MPNWCSTKIKFTGSESEIERFRKLLDEWLSKSYCQNGFDYADRYCWLGNIVGNSGIDNRDNGDFNVFCRGSIADMDWSDGELIIWEESAWAPAIRLWEMVIEKYNLDVQMLFYADECGCGIHDTNDEDYKDFYTVDCCNNGLLKEGLPEYDDFKQDALVPLLQKIVKSTETSIEKLIELVEDTFEEVWIRKWDIVSAGDYS